MSTEKLYDAVIRKHNTNPYHFERHDNCTHQIESNNFICGDRFDLYITLQDNTIKEAHFYGFGCAVSKASTSLLIQLIEGKTKSKALEIVEQFLNALNNPSIDEQLYSEEFKSFQVVKEVPARYDCAALAWLEFRNFLKG